MNRLLILNSKYGFKKFFIDVFRMWPMPLFGVLIDYVYGT